MKLLDELKFNDKGLIPAIIQDAADGQVLTLCYLNRDAIEKSLETGLVYVFRRSLGKLMMKGETSGHTQTIKEVSFDCEGNSLLFKVEQKVAACHTGYKTCYYRRYDPKTDSVAVVGQPLFDPKKVY